jgi:hypothetical protein
VISFGGDLTANGRDTVALTGPRRETSHLAVQGHRIARYDLTAEPSVLDTPEEGQSSAVSLVSQHRDATALSQGLEQEHTGRRRAAREMTPEEPLVTAQRPRPGRVHAGFDLEQLVEEQERLAVGQPVPGVE